MASETEGVMNQCALWNNEMPSEFRRVRPGRSGAMRMSTRVSRFLLSAVACFAAAVTTAQVPSPESLAHAEVLRAEALAGSNAMAIVTSLTTEVGPRLAGSEAEARARMWALDILNEKGSPTSETSPLKTTPGSDERRVLRLWRPIHSLW